MGECPPSRSRPAPMSCVVAHFTDIQTARQVDRQVEQICMYVCVGLTGNFEQTGKVRENHTKYWKTEGISE